MKRWLWYNECIYYRKYYISVNMRIKYKYEAVADELATLIQEERFPEGRLPDEQELMRTYAVGKITVYNALKSLARKGVVTRIKGKGTFVSCGMPGYVGALAQMVAVGMRTTGHYYGELFDAIARRLRADGVLCVSFGGDESLPRMNDADARLLASPALRGMIIHGGAYWKKPFLHTHPDRQSVKSVFLDYYDYDGQPPYGAVLLDYEGAMRDATVRLLKSGKKRPLLFHSTPTSVMRMTASHKSNHPLTQMREGFTRALQECGAKGEVRSFIDDDNVGLQITGLLADKDERPDVVLCNSDYMAMKIVMSALKLGIKVPGQLAVAGFYDTPWCLESPVALSSFKIDIDGMAAAAVSMLLGSQPAIVKMKPEFVVRSSAMQGGARPHLNRGAVA